jgi:glycine cleavage system H protein
MNIPAELKYALTHEWVKVEADGTVSVGISDHAQEALGDVVYIGLPEVGRAFAAQEEVAVIESVKAASGIHAPVSGTIVAVNQPAVDAPESVNEAPYTTWLFKLQPVNLSELDGLLTAEGYRQSIA